MVRMFEGAARSWKFVLGFVVASIVLWFAEFAYQFYYLIPGELYGSVLRGSALAGATMIGAALLSSALFRWVPRWGRYWHVRRSLGVVGTVFVLIHVIVVMGSLFQWDVAPLFWSWNPVENPLLFGILALPVFVAMTLTSTDWAVARMGFNRWKALHRLVYFGYMFAVFHFILINPQLLMNPAGYALVGVTFMALAGQLFWFVRTVWMKKSSPLGITVGCVVIFLWLFVGYFALAAPAIIEMKAAMAASGSPGDNVRDSVEQMREFMRTNPGDTPSGVVESDRGFSGEEVRSGTFQNLNYMSSGGVTVEEVDGKQFVVFGDDFSTPNGPDLVVYLTRNFGPTGRDDIPDGVLLGELKSTGGRQVYEIPEGTDVQSFGSVTIHCRAFNVPWSFAQLE